MARLKTDPIQLSDLNEYIESASDFSFEMSILTTVRERGFQCEHAAHYDDPVSGKSREFDIRALYEDAVFKIRLSIECKNIRENFPILVFCMRRTKGEAYLDMATIDSDMGVGVHTLKNHDLYREHDWVGKNIAQVGRNIDQTSSLTSNDSEVYDKWGQALASAHDLVQRINEDTELAKNGNIGFGFIFPIVVVPDDRLWAVHYEEDGTIRKSPHRVKRATFHIGKEYKTDVGLNASSMRLSHLEILTKSGLADFLESHMDIDRLISINEANSIRKRLQID